MLESILPQLGSNGDASPPKRPGYGFWRIERIFRGPFRWSRLGYGHVPAPRTSHPVSPFTMLEWRTPRGDPRPLRSLWLSPSLPPQQILSRVALPHGAALSGHAVRFRRIRGKHENREGHTVGGRTGCRREKFYIFCTRISRKTLFWLEFANPSLSTQARLFPLLAFLAASLCQRPSSNAISSRGLGGRGLLQTRESCSQWLRPLLTPSSTTCPAAQHGGHVSARVCCVQSRGMAKAAKGGKKGAAAAATPGKGAKDESTGGSLGVIPVNYMKDGSHPPLKPDEEYPSWLWELKVSTTLLPRSQEWSSHCSVGSHACADMGCEWNGAPSNTVRSQNEGVCDIGRRLLTDEQVLCQPKTEPAPVDQAEFLRAFARNMRVIRRSLSRRRTLTASPHSPPRPPSGRRCVTFVSRSSPSRQLPSMPVLNRIPIDDMTLLEMRRLVQLQNRAAIKDSNADPSF